MSDYKFSVLEEGRFGLEGDMSFQTAETILRESEKLFAAYDNVEVDLSAVRKTDSAGLALLLEWIRKSSTEGRQIRFSQIPEKIHAIAVTAEIDELLQRSYSSADSASPKLSSENSSSSSSKK